MGPRIIPLGDLPKTRAFRGPTPVAIQLENIHTQQILKGVLPGAIPDGVPSFLVVPVFGKPDVGPEFWFAFAHCGQYCVPITKIGPNDGVTVTGCACYEPPDSGSGKKKPILKPRPIQRSCALRLNLVNGRAQVACVSDGCTDCRQVVLLDPSGGQFRIACVCWSAG